MKAQEIEETEEAALEADGIDEQLATELDRSVAYYIDINGEDSYWARIISMMPRRIVDNPMMTCSVELVPTRSGASYRLHIGRQWFRAASPALRYLALVHEAAHVGLMHVPRFMRLLEGRNPAGARAVKAVSNIAMDFCVNTVALAGLPAFKRVHRAAVKPEASPMPGLPEWLEAAPGTMKRWTFLLPTEHDLPNGLSFEEYFLRLLQQKTTSKARDVEELLQIVMRTPGLLEELEELYAKAHGQEHAGSSADDESSAEEPSETRASAADAEKAAERLVAGQPPPVNADDAEKAAEELHKAAQSTHHGDLPAGVKKYIDLEVEASGIAWEAVLRRILRQTLTPKVTEGMASPNLSLLTSDSYSPWPGNNLDRSFKLAWMVDTSGSMSDDSYALACAELNAFMKESGATSLLYYECDAVVQKEVEVGGVEPPSNEHLRDLRYRCGYGGTNFTPFFKRLAGADDESDWMQGADKVDGGGLVNQPPDLVVVFTDGYVDLHPGIEEFHPPCPVVWLLTPDGAEARGMDLPGDVIIHCEKT